MALKEFELGTLGTSIYLFFHFLIFLWLKSELPPGGFENFKIQNRLDMGIPQGHCLPHKQPIQKF